MTLPRSHRHLLVRGGTVITMDPARRVLRGDVLVTEGRIAAVGPDLEAPPATRLLEARGLFVFPGFIQGHGNLGRTLFRGLAHGLPVPERLDRVLKLEAAHTEESAYASAVLGAADCLLSGVTTVLDTGLVRGMDGLFRALEDSGLRAWAGKSLLADAAGVPPDLRQETAAVVAETEALARRWRGTGRGRLQPAVCPRDLVQGSRELWEGAVALAAGLDAPLHAGLAETGGAAGKALGATPLEFLDACGALDSPRLSLAHRARLETAQLDLLRGRRLGLVYCPTPEVGPATGVFDLSALRDQANLAVGIGSGDAALGPASNLHDAMRAAVLLQAAAHGPAALTPQAVLEMATLDGARALGLESEIGSLEPGKFGDLVVLDLDRPGTAAAGPVDPAARVVHGAGRDAVRWVVVDGEVLVQDGVLPHLDQEGLVPRFREAGEDLVARAGIA